MRWLVLIFASLSAASFVANVSAQGVVSSFWQETYVCPKCGKTHVRQVVSQAGDVTATTGNRVSGNPVASSAARTSYKPAMGPIGTVSSMLATGVRGGVSNVLGALNAQRARQGIASLLYDPQLQVVAQRRAQRMAASGLKSHPSGSFSPGRYEGVGWSSSYSPSGVSACFTRDTRMRYAGAAMAVGRDGVYFAVVYR